MCMSLLILADPPMATYVSYPPWNFTKWICYLRLIFPIHTSFPVRTFEFQGLAPPKCKLSTWCPKGLLVSCNKRYFMPIASAHTLYWLSRPIRWISSGFNKKRGSAKHNHFPRNQLKGNAPDIPKDSRGVLLYLSTP